MEGGHTPRSTVLTADSLLGPYQIVRTGLRPCGMNAGDFGLVVDPHSVLLAIASTEGRFG